MRKVYVETTVRLIINVDDDIEISKVMEEMDYSFSSTMEEAHVEDTEITDWNITNSK